MLLCLLYYLHTRQFFLWPLFGFISILLTWDYKRCFCCCCCICVPANIAYLISGNNHPNLCSGNTKLFTLSSDKILRERETQKHKYCITITKIRTELKLPLYVPVIFHEQGPISLSSLLKKACCTNICITRNKLSRTHTSSNRCYQKPKAYNQLISHPQQIEGNQSTLAFN